jgi:hypothetical protein
VVDNDSHDAEYAASAGVPNKAVPLTRMMPRKSASRLDADFVDVSMFAIIPAFYGALAFRKEKYMSDCEAS